MHAEEQRRCSFIQLCFSSRWPSVLEAHIHDIHTHSCLLTAIQDVLWVPNVSCAHVGGCNGSSRSVMVVAFAMTQNREEIGMEALSYRQTTKSYKLSITMEFYFPICSILPKSIPILCSHFCLVRLLNEIILRSIYIVIYFKSSVNVIVE